MSYNKYPKGMKAAELTALLKFIKRVYRDEKLHIIINIIQKVGD